MTGRLRIAILDDFQDAVRTLDCFDRLRDHDVTVFTDHVGDEAVLARRLAEFDALVPIRERTQLTGRLLERLPRLKIISLTGPDSGQIDAAACDRLGIRLLQGGNSGASTPELTWGLILAAMRQIPQEDQRVRAGLWQGSLGRVLAGRTLGILGYGRIGARVAGYGKAFGMRVMAWGRAGSQDRARQDGIDVAPDHATFFATADVLTVHVKLSAQSAGMIGPSELARMKPDALIVNTSRSALIKPGALQAALRAGRPGMAALDVFDDEPVDGPIDGPPGLQTLHQVILTPHLGYVTREGYDGLFGPAFERLVTALKALAGSRSAAGPSHE